MNLQTYTSPAAFLSRIQSNLEQDEVVNNLMLGLALRLVQQPDFYQTTPFLATVEEGGELLLAALRTPPYNLILYAAAEDIEEALLALVSYLRAENYSVPGVLGPADLAASFARLYQRETDALSTLFRRERVFKLTAVNAIRPTTGMMRKASNSDMDLLLDWTRAFNLEAIGKNEPAEVLLDQVRHRLPGAYLWEDERSSAFSAGRSPAFSAGRPVSLACVGRTLPHGAVVGPVYTPPEQRGRGYASACVAALSQLLLDAGYEFCCLFTDLANPTSNHIYQVIGYQPGQEFHEYHFG